MAKLPHNLLVRSNGAKACYKISVGWIGDAAHQTEQSDHNVDSRGLVHALDFMCTGAHAQAIVNWGLAHNADLEYIIHNRVIWTRSNNWKPKKYTGSDPHTNHVHFSGKHGSAGKNSATGTGYDVAAENSTPNPGAPCTASTPHPAPAKPAAPASTTHKPGSRTLTYTPDKTQMTGADVQFLQKFLGVPVEGGYGPVTAKRASWYEGMRGIHQEKPYGQAGPQFWSNVLGK